MYASSNPKPAYYTTVHGTFFLFLVQFWNRQLARWLVPRLCIACVLFQFASVRYSGSVSRGYSSLCQNFFYFSCLDQQLQPVLGLACSQAMVLKEIVFSKYQDLSQAGWFRLADVAIRVTLLIISVVRRPSIYIVFRGHFSNQSVNVSCLKQVSLFFSPGAGCDGKGDQQPPFAAWLRNSRFAMSSWVVTRVSSGPRILLYSYLQGQAAGSSSSSLPGLSFSTSHWAPVSGWWMLPMPCELLKATVSQCELPKCLIVFDCYRYAIDVYWCYIRCFYLFLVVSVGPGLALLLVLLQCLNIQFCRWPSSILQPMSLPHFTLLIQRHE